MRLLNPHGWTQKTLDSFIDKLTTRTSHYSPMGEEIIRDPQIGVGAYLRIEYAKKSGKHETVEQYVSSLDMICMRLTTSDTGKNLGTATFGQEILRRLTLREVPQEYTYTNILSYNVLIPTKDKYHLGQTVMLKNDDPITSKNRVIGQEQIVCIDHYEIVTTSSSVNITFPRKHYSKEKTHSRKRFKERYGV